MVLQTAFLCYTVYAAVCYALMIRVLAEILRLRPQDEDLKEEDAVFIGAILVFAPLIMGVFVFVLLLFGVGEFVRKTLYFIGKYFDKFVNKARPADPGTEFPKFG